jgi:hypothetical protein
MATFRIIKIGSKYEVEKKIFLFGWKSIFIEALGEGPYFFDSIKEAEAGINDLYTPVKKEIIKVIKK